MNLENITLALALIYSIYLIKNNDITTLLIFITFSIILAIKFKPIEYGVIFSFIFTLFLTKYHQVFPDRYNRNKSIPVQVGAEGFSNKNYKTDEEKESIRKRKKRICRKKKLAKRLSKAKDKMGSDMPKRYQKNMKFIFGKRSKNISQSLEKFTRLKENFFMILDI